MARGKIICSFFGTGKTYMNKNYPNYLDLETYYFGDRKDLLAMAIKDGSRAYGYNVLVACTKPIIELLQDNDLDFVAVLPSKDLKQEYLERFKKRGSPPEIIKGLENNFDKHIDEVMKLNCKKIILKSGEYLKDVIDQIEKR